MAIKSHIVPRFYLSLFTPSPETDDGRLFVYEKDKEIRPSIPKREGCEKGYFQYETPDGNSEQVIEETLGRTESDAAAILQSIDKDSFVFSQAEFSKIAEFTGLTFGRVKASRDSSAEVLRHLAKQLVELADEDDAWLDAMVQRYASAGISTAKEVVRDSIKRVGGQSGTDKALVLYGMFHKAEVIADYLRGLDWRILCTPDDTPFITSDNPVVTWRVDQYGQVTVGHGFAHPDTRVYFPLSAKTCLLMGRGLNCGRFYIPRSTTRLINKSLIWPMTRNVYSNQESAKLTALINHDGASLKYLKDVFVPKMNDNKELLRQFTTRRTDLLVDAYRREHSPQ